MKIFEDLLDKASHCFPFEDPIRITVSSCSHSMYFVAEMNKIDPFSHTGVLDVYATRLREGVDSLEWRSIQDLALSNEKIEESLKILPEDIKKFQIHIATFVNALYSGAPVRVIF